MNIEQAIADLAAALTRNAEALDRNTEALNAVLAAADTTPTKQAAPRKETTKPAGRNKAAPVEETPVEAAPVEAAPVEAAPVEAAPVEEAPVEETPVEETPVEETPTDAPVLTLEGLKDNVRSMLNNAGGKRIEFQQRYETVRAEFGIARVDELDPSDYGRFWSRVEEMLLA